VCCSLQLNLFSTDHHRGADDDMTRDWTQLSGNRVSRRTLLQFSAGAGMLTALGACSGESPSGQSGAGQRGGSLVAAWNLDRFSTLDPQLAVGADQMSLLINVTEGLTRLTPSLEVEGALADSWEVSQDGRNYTFKLRKGVKWHNGDDFTAQDMLFTYERGLDPALGSPSAGGLAPIADVKAPDDYTVVFILKSPFAPFLTTLTGMPGRILAPVNKRALDEMGAEQYGVKPMGTGPFQISEHQPGDHLTLTRFDNYWERSYPLLDEVRVDLIPEPSTVQSALLSGDIQFANILRPQTYQALETAPSVRALSVPGPNWWGQWLNYDSAEAPFLADPRVRLAFAKAVNRRELVDKALFGQGDVGYGVYNLATKWAYNQNLPRTFAHDPEGAKRLLSEADATGVTVQYMTNPGFQRTDEVMADMLSRVGIDVQLDLVETSVYSQRGYTASDYQMMHSGSAADPDPDDSVYNYFHTSGAYNTFNYANRKADTLIDRQRILTDRDQRVAALWELEELLINDVACGFTYHSRDLVGMSQNVAGYEAIPELRSFRTVSLGDQ